MRRVLRNMSVMGNLNSKPSCPKPSAPPAAQRILLHVECLSGQRRVDRIVLLESARGGIITLPPGIDIQPLACTPRPNCRNCGAPPQASPRCAYCDTYYG